VPPDPTIALHLIQQVAKQDRDAFSQLYDRFSTLVFTLAMRMLKARSDAEDLLQEVLSKFGVRRKLQRGGAAGSMDHKHCA
jgi:RNA polymerase sigma-70 factor (ECF subfamily)